MKITKRQLKRIIKEERSKLMEQSRPGNPNKPWKPSDHFAMQEMLSELDDDLYTAIVSGLNEPIRLIQEHIGENLGKKITGDFAGASMPDIVSDIQNVLLRYARDEYMNHTR